MFLAKDRQASVPEPPNADHGEPDEWKPDQQQAELPGEKPWIVGEAVRVVVPGATEKGSKPACASPRAISVLEAEPERRRRRTVVPLHVGLDDASARTDFPPPFAPSAGRRNGFPATVRPGHEQISHHHSPRAQAGGTFLITVRPERRPK